MRETKEAKAMRLVQQHRVEFRSLTPTVALASVVGDSDKYQTWRNEYGQWNCSCPYGKHSCSHIIAATTIYRAVLPALKGDNHGK